MEFIIVQDKYVKMKKAIKEYCAELMKFSEIQKDKWNLLPSISKQANGITGYNDSLSVCTEHKIWRINNISNGYYTFCVDCITGKIKYQNYDNDICLDEKDINFLLSMAKINVNDVNCDIIIKNLKMKINTER